MDIQLTQIFVKVVQNSSFSRAAEILKMPKSTVSKAVTLLEKNTGTKLLLRTTRSLTLTPAGRAFYESCSGPIQILEDAEKSLYGQDSIVAGQLKITAPEDLGAHVISPAIGELSQRHPGLQFELRYSDEVIDLVREGFDLAIRVGKPQESRLRAKRIGDVILVMVATPQYLSQSPRIKTPQELTQHACLSLTRLEHWVLQSSKKESARVPIRSRVTSNQMTSLMGAALAGAGVALVPMYLCCEEIRQGRLQRVLPDWSSPGMQVSLLSPLPTSASVRLKITADYLYDSIRAILNPDLSSSKSAKS